MLGSRSVQHTVEVRAGTRATGRLLTLTALVPGVAVRCLSASSKMLFRPLLVVVMAHFEASTVQEGR